MTAEQLLEVRDLKVSFRTEDGIIRAVDGVSLTLSEGETLGIVGESGSGKSVTMMSVMRLINDPNARFEGEVLYKGRDLMKLDQAQIRGIRGAGIAMIFQDPMTSLNPVYRVGWQIEEQVREHEKISRQAAHARAIELLTAVGIPQAADRVNDYPHQFSGGMRQRVMIAMALSCNPDILVADEPTTALDVTIQAQILDLLREMKTTLNLALLLITHDLGVIAETADRVAVMYGGRIVEHGRVREIFRNPQHPYTRGLLASMPRPGERGRLRAIEGTVPVLGALPAGCTFHPRCGYRFEPCDRAVPPDYDVGPDHGSRCYLHDPSLHPDAAR